MSQKRIVIIAEIPTVAEDIHLMLENIGYSVSGSYTKGEDVLEAITKEKPDLILMDFQLKGELSYIETAKTIRDTFDIPTISLTSNTDHNTLRQAKTVGTYGCIIKPIKAEDLKSTIEIGLHKHQMEDKLREREQWFRTTLQSIDDGVITTDMEGRIKFMNQVAESITGWDRETAMGRHVQEIFHLVDEYTMTPVETPVSKVTSNGHTFGLSNNTLLIDKDGRKIPIKNSWTPIVLENGRRIGVVLAFQDVTHDREIEKRFRESENRFRLLFENTPAGYQSLDNNGCFNEVNPYWLKLMGYERDEVIGRPFSDFLHADWMEHFQTHFPKFISVGEVLGVEFEMRRKDGSYITVNLDGKTGKTTTGEFKQTHCVLTDITVQARSARALRDAHQRMLTIFNGIDAQIYVVDIKSHEILFMNELMKREYGGDFTGKTCWKVFCDKNNPCRHCKVPPLDEKQKEFSDPIVWEDINAVTGKLYVNTDRSIKWIDGRIAKLQVARDVTAQKVLEEKLRQAQKMESIGTLAGGIAHDFNNILMAILGFTELACEDAEQGSSLEENLQEVLVAGKRAKELVKNILGFARQTDGHIKPVRISAIVKETLGFIRSSIPTTIQIETYIGTDATIMADPTQLHQVLMNLCTNAFQAMEDKGGVLRIRLREKLIEERRYIGHEELPTGKYFQLEVSDTGEGIPENILDSIFEPYFTTKKTGEGTGMGLAMVHGVIKSLKGEIFVSSVKGKGTTFTIYLPFTKKDHIADIITQDDLPRGKENILLVDDEFPIAKIACKVLNSLGYTTTYRTSSLAALALFKEDPNQFDLVLTDMTMPDMTGYTLAEEVTILRPDIPIILCTGYSKKISKAQAADLNIRATLIKPVSKQDMAKTVREVLDEK